MHTAQRDDKYVLLLFIHVERNGRKGEQQKISRFLAVWDLELRSEMKVCSFSNSNVTFRNNCIL